MRHVLPHPAILSDPHAASLSTGWLRYFLANRANLRTIPWEADYRLTPEEWGAIASSIQKFQLGESSEGTHLMKVARDYAEQTQDPDWVPVVKLFIGEEQRHAKDLGRFMQQQQIPLAHKDWSDQWFRRFRRLSNLEGALMVLLTAELVATLYYRALGLATRSPTLQHLCDQIVADETQHVRFQTEVLQQIRATHPHWRKALIDRGYALFFRLTLGVVWADHRAVLQASYPNFGSFYSEAIRALHTSGWL